MRSGCNLAIILPRSCKISHDLTKILVRSCKIHHDLTKILAKSCKITHDLTKILARSCKISQDLGKILVKSCKIMRDLGKILPGSWQDLGRILAGSWQDISKILPRSCQDVQPGLSLGTLHGCSQRPYLPWVRLRVWVRVALVLASRKGWVGMWPARPTCRMESVAKVCLLRMPAFDLMLNVTKA